jgi:hypothetical protein
MTTPSGQISLNDVNVELTLSGTTLIEMNQANVRTLAGVGGSGTVISMQNLQNKTFRVAISSTFSSNTANATLNLSAISGYVSGKSDITVTINSGVYLYSTSTGGYGLNISGATTGDTLTIVNNGFILGQGGAGGANSSGGASGGPALNLGFGMSACTINNTNGSAYIAGGGGGGGGGSGNSGAGGAGGGAGAGSGGSGSGGGGGAGGGLGASGASGSGNPGGGGGGGGRVLAGSGGAGAGASGAGSGGGAGGGGGGSRVTAGKSTSDFGGGNGGSANGGGSAGSSSQGAGGGGGWGSSGGSGAVGAGSGGKAVNLNGKSLTWTSGNTTRVYGAVS